jgi:xanthine dehydrogenase accessory factor
VSELTDILDAIEAATARGEPMALATIVATTGSTYRRAGARLFIRAEGDPIGNISGGCLEGDVARIGREVMADGQPRLATFDLTADDDAVWGYGLGCNGAFEILVEPTAGAVKTADALRQALTGSPTCLATTLTGPHAGSHRLKADGAAAAALRDGTPRVVEEGGERLLYEPILPPLRLVICGAGHDAIPLVRQAAELGWRVTVAAGVIGPDDRTAVVLMSHNYLRDIAYLRSFVGAQLAYFGVMGPRGRTEQMLGEIGEPAAIERLQAPAGLDIGAEGPEEVARAIVAEILAVTNGRAGGQLRDRRGPIHAD